AGLVLGKPLGVFSATWLALKAGLGRLPEGMRRLHLIGVALLAGAGFTMSLFIATLAYADPNTLAAAKLAVVIGSFASIVAATCLLIAGGRIDDSIGEDGPPDMDAVKHRSGPGERSGAAPE
ncbi:MAG: Na+/H+ antiporter NhaA, partial [Pseudomonadota bacterium]